MKNNIPNKTKILIFWNFLKQNRVDFTKFLVYFWFFSFLLFTFQTVNSPQGYTVMNSANEKTTITFDNIDNTTSLVPKKIPNKPTLTIQYNPDNAKIDNNLLKILKFNINSKFFNSKVTPLNLIIDSVRLEPRWQVIGKELILSTKIKELNESTKVFVHELWHIVDLHFLPNIWDYDPSENFYNISRMSYNVKKKNAKLADFVSWYALTNKYEDFAESFWFYVFHNEEFKRRSLENIIISRKYNYLKKYVFFDDEFLFTSFNNELIKSYNWDSTKININLKKYLYYIK